MQSLIAYILTLVLIPVVGLLMFVLTFPLTAALIDHSSKASFLIGHMLSNVARCAAAWAVFYWLGVPFGIEPLLLIGIVMAAVDLGRVKQCLDAYAGRLNELGLQTDSSPTLLGMARMSDDKFSTLCGDVGDSMAGLVGCLVGVGISIAVWLSMPMPV